MPRFGSGGLQQTARSTGRFRAGSYISKSAVQEYTIVPQTSTTQVNPEQEKINTAISSLKSKREELIQAHDALGEKQFYGADVKGEMSKIANRIMSLNTTINLYEKMSRQGYSQTEIQNYTDKVSRETQIQIARSRTAKEQGVSVQELERQTLKKQQEASKVVSVDQVQQEMYQRQGFSKSEAIILAQEGEVRQQSFTPEQARSVLAENREKSQYLQSTKQGIKDIRTGQVVAPIGTPTSQIELKTTREEATKQLLKKTTTTPQSSAILPSLSMKVDQHEKYIIEKQVDTYNAPDGQVIPVTKVYVTNEAGQILREATSDERSEFRKGARVLGVEAEGQRGLVSKSKENLYYGQYLLPGIEKTSKGVVAIKESKQYTMLVQPVLDFIGRFNIEKRFPEKQFMTGTVPLTPAVSFGSVSRVTFGGVSQAYRGDLLMTRMEFATDKGYKGVAFGLTNIIKQKDKVSVGRTAIIGAMKKDVYRFPSLTPISESSKGFVAGDISISGLKKSKLVKDLGGVERLRDLKTLSSASGGQVFTIESSGKVTSDVYKTISGGIKSKRITAIGGATGSQRGSALSLGLIKQISSKELDFIAKGGAGLKADASLKALQSTKSGLSAGVITSRTTTPLSSTFSAEEVLIKDVSMKSISPTKVEQISPTKVEQISLTKVEQVTEPSLLKPQVSGSDVKLSSISSYKTVQLNRVVGKTRTTQFSPSKSLQRLSTKQKQESKQKGQTKLVQPSANRISQGYKQVQLQKQLTRQRSLLSLRTKLVQTTFIPFVPMSIIRPRTPPMFPRSKPSKKTKEDRGIYEAGIYRYVDGKRKRLVVATGSLSDVFQKGVSVTTGTLARTFDVRTASGKPVTNLPIPKGFRLGKTSKTKKPATLVQKSKFSLGSIGEISEIQTARRKRI